MKIVVTGASGHLGQWVVSSLVSSGHDVAALSRRPLGAPNISGLCWSRPVELVTCDLSSVESVDAVRAVLESAEAVVHLAAHIPGDTARNDPEDAAATLEVNVVGTIHLLAALRGAARLRSVVHASTFEVYGTPRSSPIGEDHPLEPLGYYGASKLAAEKYVALFGSERGLPCVSLRMPAVYGPGDRLVRAIGNFIRSAVQQKSLAIQGDGEDLRELLYVGDACDAVSSALQAGASGAFNVASGVGYSIRAMAEAVLGAARAEGIEAGDGSIAFSERRKPRMDYVLSIDRARQELAWEPKTPIGDGVRAQLRWERARRM